MKIASNNLSVKTIAVLTLSMFFTLALNPCYAQDSDEKKPFVESPVQLPIPPDATNLLMFYHSETQQFFIDIQSMSIAADGSLRYSLVAKSKSGATNVSYEGLRCETLQKRLFAFGRRDGSWSESQRTEWESISNTGVNRQHSTLAWDFVCDYNRISGGIDKIVHRIRRNESLQRLP